MLWLSQKPQQEYFLKLIKCLLQLHFPARVCWLFCFLMTNDKISMEEFQIKLWFAYLTQSKPTTESYVVRESRHYLEVIQFPDSLMD